ncbi:putative redox protein [Flavobacterium sp. CG_23.5]|uniref:OsmC family protein n=1 Tax=unclassified Flavobacterium TaxID=196869 RepID=UPI0018CA2C4D|nr:MULTISPECIES: OsmC family protein [unclassified Flavobacterium]MBG6110269.1 putative redox protein [Flavobacterium sp. CG_9.10]MBP2284184.1 putative redox protein [Flavobacterium sp. CG_23.5]
MTNLLEQDITGHIGLQKYLCTISWRNGSLIMDEPKSIDGNDLGPDPYSMFLASLAGCTLSTLRMYIDRKGWVIPEINITLNATQETGDELTTTISRSITFSTEITTEQKERLLIIANKCPVSKILKGNITINTKL